MAGEADKSSCSRLQKEVVLNSLIVLWVNAIGTECLVHGRSELWKDDILEAKWAASISSRCRRIEAFVELVGSCYREVFVVLDAALLQHQITNKMRHVDSEE